MVGINLPLQRKLEPLCPDGLDMRRSYTLVIKTIMIVTTRMTHDFARKSRP